MGEQLEVIDRVFSQKELRGFTAFDSARATGRQVERELQREGLASLREVVDVPAIGYLAVVQTTTHLVFVGSRGSRRRISIRECQRELTPESTPVKPQKKRKK